VTADREQTRKAFADIVQAAASNCLRRPHSMYMHVMTQHALKALGFGKDLAQNI
jgi:hypothetical protein